MTGEWRRITYVQLPLCHTQDKHPLKRRGRKMRRKRRRRWRRRKRGRRRRWKWRRRGRRWLRGGMFDGDYSLLYQF